MAKTLKLNQVIAILRQVKDSSQKQTTELYQLLTKEGLFTGLSRTYKPKDEDGERLPSESKIVQVRVHHLLKRVAELEIPWFDLVARQDAANCEAKADVVVGDKAVLKDVPATTLLWLEHRLQDMHSVIVKLPELSQTDKWTWDANQDCYATEPTETAKSKKVPKPFVKAEATKEHPAQVDVVYDDVLVGYWTLVNYSGALPKDKKQRLRERCEALMMAVKKAREEANLTVVSEKEIGKPVYDFLFQDLG